MVSHGWLDEETLAEALAYQENLPRVRLDKESVEQHAAALPGELATRLRALYIGDDAVDGRRVARIAVASALGDEARAELEAALGLPPFPMVARESEIAAGLRLLHGQRNAFDKNQTEAGVPLLGDLLIGGGMLSREVFDAAMQRYRPDRHGRIGDYLVAQSVISRDAIEQAVREQRRLFQRNGGQMA
ncbi:hypothetical protein [Herbaspirillum sp. 3C11]|nr:hypothetical protein [Herbaspirillum sp. 3C11]TFI27434.1 hypothetical protein E4P30_09975 [Herbaspirillum sp. 3C11]